MSPQARKLHHHGLYVTQARTRVMRVLEQEGAFLPPEVVQERLRQSGCELALSTIRHILEAFARAGLPL